MGNISSRTFSQLERSHIDIFGHLVREEKGFFYSDEYMLFFFTVTAIDEMPMAAVNRKIMNMLN